MVWSDNLYCNTVGEELGTGVFHRTTMVGQVWPPGWPCTVFNLQNTFSLAIQMMESKIVHTCIWLETEIVCSWICDKISDSLNSMIVSALPILMIKLCTSTGL